MKILLLFFLTTWTYADPTPVGSYDHGKLLDAECLPQDGEGYMQLYRDVDRIWGTMPMIVMIQKTAAEMSERFPNRDRLQIEEISAKNGGEVDGHASHENGQDVDIQYYKADGVEHDPVATNQEYADPMVVGTKVSENFDLERNWELVKTLHKHGDVRRIFMDQKLKNQLCEYAKSKKDYATNIQVLRSIQHVANHQDHLHVRIGCPPAAKACINQAPRPPGSGCP